MIMLFRQLARGAARLVHPCHIAPIGQRRTQGGDAGLQLHNTALYPLLDQLTAAVAIRGNNRQPGGKRLER